MSLIHNIQRCLLSTLLTFMPAHTIYLAYHLSRYCFFLSLCIGRLTESIYSYVMGIQSYDMDVRFLFLNYSMYFILNIIIIKWCIIEIIEIYYGPEQFCILFISWVFHAGSFACCVKIVQEIISTLEYVKIAWLLDNWIIRNQRFLVICLIICIFFFFILLCTNYYSLSPIEISSRIRLSDSSSSVE